MNSRKKVILITGPTASGKTAAAIRVALKHSTEIISADSRQCYRELNIGVARPSEEELRTVPHHFIASHSIHEQVTAATFEQFALTKTRELFQRHDVVVMTGGTGLYIRAFCEGLDPIPDVDPAIREKINTLFEAEGLEGLTRLLRERDPVFFESGETANPHRVMRALEVQEATGRSILTFQKGEVSSREFDIEKWGIAIEKEQLRKQIDHRVDRMMEAGLIDEARPLLPFRSLQALQTVGYTEIFDYLEGRLSLERAVGDIKIHTRQYAKRQMTWFRKDADIRWVAASAIN